MNIDENEFMNMDELQKEAETDLSFDITDATIQSMKIPLLTCKYSTYLMQSKASQKKYEIELATLYADKFEYYSKDYALKIDRRDIEKFIKADKEYRAVQRKYEFHSLQVEFISNILKALDKASWNIGNAIKKHIFDNGG